MKKHTCKNPSCNRIFEYCRGCLLSPIPYKDAGFCSKDCYEASKIKVTQVVEIEPIEEEITTVVTEKVVEDIEPIEEEVSVEVEAETVVLAETTTVAEPIIKKETYNTYKKKKNKYR